MREFYFYRDDYVKSLMKMNLQYFGWRTTKRGIGYAWDRLEDDIGLGGESHGNDRSHDFSPHESGKERGRKVKSAAKRAKKAKKKGKKASKNSGSSNSSSGSSDKVTAAQRLSFETGTGLPFSGSMAAQLVHAIMFRFILGDSDLNENVGKIDLLYHYRFFSPYTKKVQYLNVRRLIDMDIPDDAVDWIINHHNKYNIFNPDEAMNSDPNRFIQYEGTLDQFIRDISNAPFNEVYWTHEEEYDHLDTIGKAQTEALDNLPADPYTGSPGNDILEKDYNLRIPHATLHFRQTPFQPQMWRQLPIVSIGMSDVIDYSLDRNDTEQKAVFNITNDGMNVEDINNLPPVTDDREELQRRYGYAYMNITSDYFMNTNSFSGMDTQNLTRAIGEQDRQLIPQDAWITYPSSTTFNDYFGPDAATQLERVGDPHLLQELPMSPQEGGTRLYDQTLSYLENHMSIYLRDEIEYQISVLFTTYIDSLSGTTNNQQSVTNPASLPSGATFERAIQQTNTFATRMYSRWITDLADLKSADMRTNQNVSANLDHDLWNMVRNPNNVYRTYNTRTNTYEKDNGAPDPVITYQKAGQLVMHYITVINRTGSGNEIGSFLKNPGVTALNPWLKQIEHPGKSSNKDKNIKNPEQQSQQSAALAEIGQLSRLGTGRG